MALGDSESASRGVDEVMELPACDMKEKRVQSLHYRTDRSPLPCLSRVRRVIRFDTRQCSKRMAKVGRARRAHNTM